MQRIEPQEFWKWAYSDFLSNALRGVLAEHIVAKAIGGVQQPRIQWDYYDLKAPDGLTTIEVKSASYLQSWDQERHSVLRFDIAPKQAWDEKSSSWSDKVLRNADVYVFAVFSATDKRTADPLSLEQWFFMACRSTRLNEHFHEQQSVGISSLEQLGLKRLTFTDLAEEVGRLAKPPKKGARSSKQQ